MKIAHLRKDFQNSFSFSTDLRGWGEHEIFKNTHPFSLLGLKTLNPEALAHKLIELNFEIHSYDQIVFVTTNQLKIDQHKDQSLQLSLLAAHLLTDARMKVQRVKQVLFFPLKHALQNANVPYELLKPLVWEHLAQNQFAQFNQQKDPFQIDIPTALTLNQLNLLQKEINLNAAFLNLSMDEVKNMIGLSYELYKDINPETQITQITKIKKAG